MKIARLFAAVGLMTVSLGTATMADAQGRGDRYERHHDGRGDHGFRHDRGRHGYRDDRHGFRAHHRCHVEHRHHRRVRVCR